MVFFVTFFSIIHTDDPQRYAYIDLGHYKSDLFYQLETVVGILDQYENNKYSGVKVDSEWQSGHCSCCQNNGWWEYFFKKIEVGDTTGKLRRIPDYEKMTALNFCLYGLSFGRAHELIKKYTEVQPKIREKVTSYQKEFFDDSFVIGVCYVGGSSSPYAAPNISYKKIYDILLVHIVEKNNLKIFVYTEDKRFYSFLKVKHPDIVFEYKGREYFATNMDRGEYELINCLLLSQTNFLIRTRSRFSFVVSQFNPLLPVVELGGNLQKLCNIIKISTEVRDYL